MAEENDPFGQTFGPGGCNVFGLENIEDIGAENAKGACDATEAEYQSGEDEMVGDVEELRGWGEEVMIEGGEAADGKPTGAGRHPNGKKSQKEFGNGQCQVGGCRSETIDPSSGAGSGKNGKWDGEDPGKEERSNGKKDGGGCTLRNELRDGNLVGPRVSEIEMKNISEPEGILFIPGSIETERFLEFGNQCGVDVALGFDGGEEVARSEAHQGEDEKGDSK